MVYMLFSKFFPPPDSNLSSVYLYNHLSTSIVFAKRAPLFPFLVPLFQFHKNCFEFLLTFYFFSFRLPPAQSPRHNLPAPAYNALWWTMFSKTHWKLPLFPQYWRFLPYLQNAEYICGWLFLLRQSQNRLYIPWIAAASFSMWRERPVRITCHRHGSGRNWQKLCKWNSYATRQKKKPAVQIIYLYRRLFFSTLLYLSQSVPQTEDYIHPSNQAVYHPCQKSRLQTSYLSSHKNAAEISNRKWTAQRNGDSSRKIFPKRYSKNPLNTISSQIPAVSSFPL